MKSRFRALWLISSIAIILLLAVGCNDTLRQFIVPVPSPTGNPQALEHGVILSTNPASSTSDTAVGSDTHIDVSGDSNAGIVALGVNPVFLGKAAGNAFVINKGDANVPPTVSLYTALLPQSAIAATITLPATGPNTALNPVAGTTSSTGNIYIANQGSDNVSVISNIVRAVIANVPLPAGASPAMIAGNAANNKIFVVNNGTNNVTEISTIDNTIIGSPIPVGVQPIWGVMSNDGLFVFIVNQGSGTVTVIDASLDQAIATVPVGPSPNFAFYEPKLKRVYVSNTGNNTVSVIAASGINSLASPPVLPVKLRDVTLSGSPTSVTALTDGTKAYAALGNCGTGVNHLTLLNPAATTNNLATCNGNLVSVIDATALAESSTITVGPGVVSVDSSADASRVFAISAKDITTISDNVNTVPQANRTFPTPSIYVIPTSTNVPLVTPVDASIVSRPLPTFHTPQQDPKCVAAIDPAFNSKVAIPCLLQTPFEVRAFP